MGGSVEGSAGISVGGKAAVSVEASVGGASRVWAGVGRSGMAQLYARNRRDAVVMYGLIHHMELGEVNDRLYEENEATLC